MSAGIVDRALERAKQYSGAFDISTVFGVIKALGVLDGGDALLKHLADSKLDEDFDDYLAEVWFIAAFTSCGYEITIYPEGSEGPDLLIRKNGESSYVEVTRFRKDGEGPPPMPDDSENHQLPGYGSPQKDQRKANNKIFHKFRQTGTLPSAVAIWNDDGDMEDVEVEAASGEIRINPLRPPNLEMVLYGSKWIGDRQFYAFPLSEQRSPVMVHLDESIAPVTWSTAVSEFVRGFV